MWKTVKLGEIATWVRGLTYSKKDEVENDGIAVLRATNIDLATHKIVLDDIRYVNETVKVKEEKYTQVGDLLVCTASGSKSHVGKVAIVEDDLGMAFGGFMAAIRCNEHCFPRYLYHVLTSQDFKSHLKSLGDGANINNLKFSQIEEYEVPLPPLAEQQRIVAKLDAAFAEIDRAIEASEEKLASTVQLKIRALAKLLSESKSNSPPTPLESCVETYHQGLNTAGEKVKFSDSGYPVLQTRNINDGQIDFVEKIKFVDEKLWEKYKAKYKPEVGDVFFTNIGTIGKTAVVTEDRDYLIHWNIFKLRTKGNKLLPEFLKLNLDFLTDCGYFSSKQKGGTVNFVTKKMIGSAPICLCSIEKQEKLLEISSKIEVACEIAKSSTENKLSQLAKLKSAILDQELQPTQSEAA